jgi:ribosomal protein L17
LLNNTPKELQQDITNNEIEATKNKSKHISIIVEKFIKAREDCINNLRSKVNDL